MRSPQILRGKKAKNASNVRKALRKRLIGRLQTKMLHVNLGSKTDLISQSIPHFTPLSLYNQLSFFALRGKAQPGLKKMSEKINVGGLIREPFHTDAVNNAREIISLKWTP